MNKVVEVQGLRVAQVRASARRSSLERQAWGIAGGLLSVVFHDGLAFFQIGAVACAMYSGAALIPSPVQALAKAISPDFIDRAFWGVMILGGVVAAAGTVHLVAGSVLDKRWARARAERQGRGQLQ